MAVKKVYTIKDKILNNEYEVFGQNGVLQQEKAGLMLLDFSQMAQYIIENCAKESEKEDTYTVINKELIEECNNYAEKIYDIVVNTVYYNAISDIKDDEELETIK